MDKLTGLEKFICSEWSGWDELDTGVFMFYDPVLLDHIKADIGHDVVSYIVLDTAKSSVQFYVSSEDEVYIDRNLKLSVDKA